MLPRKNRLTKKEVQDIFDGGVFFSLQDISIKVLKDGTEDVKIACLVGKKNMQSAVARNRVRRQMQSIVQEMLPEVRQGQMMVLIYTGKKEQIERKELEEKIRDILQEASHIDL